MDMEINNLDLKVYPLANHGWVSHPFFSFFSFSFFFVFF